MVGSLDSSQTSGIGGYGDDNKGMRRLTDAIWADGCGELGEGAKIRQAGPVEYGMK